jgi:hypothetical protein
MPESWGNPILSHRVAGHRASLPYMWPKSQIRRNQRIEPITYGETMLGTFLDKATGLLDKSFLLAYWFPVFVSASLAVLIFIYDCGCKAALDWWQQDLMVRGHESGFYAQLLIVAGALILITVLAYLIQPFTQPVIRFYKGYWPLTIRGWVVSFPKWGELNVWKQKVKQRTEAEMNGDWSSFSQVHAELYYGYPSRKDRLMPTRLGNILNAGEDYSMAAYGMDFSFWWPRLLPLLSEATKKDLNESIITMVALLNFSSLIIFVSLAGLAYLGQKGLWWQSFMVFGIGIVLAFVSYRAAASHAYSYVERTRSTVDLYRFDLLESLHQKLPKTLAEEIRLWEQLMLWLYNNDRGVVRCMKYNLKVR